MSDFFSTTKVKKTRKEHICDCCGSTIQKGEELIKYAGVYEGDFFASKVCPQCDKIVEFYCDEYGTNEWCLNEVIGEVWNYAEVQELLKQIKHPSKYVLSCIEDYEEYMKERLLNGN